MKPRYLTKSRFKLALDCPTKLYYTRKPEYENKSESDSFLEALAQGGFQVEELARMDYPEGIAIIGDDYNYDLLAEKTRKLLEQENVTIFEPAFLINDLFIRVDILVKEGNNVKLIEVKAKSIRGEDHESFIKSNGKLGGGWDLYLYDIAFQKYVIQSCYSEWKISSYLKLADKNATTTVDGLHQCFKVVSGSDLRTGIEKKEGITKADLGDPILCEINVNEEIDLILNTNPLDENRSFEETVKQYKGHYKNDVKLFTEIGLHCKGCEFITEDHSNGSRSGFHECWQEQLQLPKEKIDQPKGL